METVVAVTLGVGVAGLCLSLCGLLVKLYAAASKRAHDTCQESALRKLLSMVARPR